jgi:hypothetical protein
LGVAPGAPGMAQAIRPANTGNSKAMRIGLMGFLLRG